MNQGIRVLTLKIVLLVYKSKVSTKVFAENALVFVLGVFAGIGSSRPEQIKFLCVGARQGGRICEPSLKSLT